jgi:hypothetical protein
MGRIRNRRELRAAYDAAEQRKDDDDKDLSDEAEEEEEADEEEESDDDEEVTEKPATRKASTKSRTRVSAPTRLRIVWGVYDNTHKCVATYDYPRRGEADAHASRLTAEKKNMHYVQPIKETLDERK